MQVPAIIGKCNRWLTLNLGNCHPAEQYFVMAIRAIPHEVVDRKHEYVRVVGGTRDLSLDDVEEQKEDDEADTATVCSKS